MRRLLTEAIPLLSTIAMRGGGFVAEVKNCRDVKFVEVTQANRQTMPGQVVAWVKHHTAEAKTL
jgi:hypothetical protein